MDGPDDSSVLETLKRAAAAMSKAGVPFALAGSVAAYARGGALPSHDVDFVIMEQDVPAAEKALAGVGMEIVHPPEDWLVKAYDDGTLVDLIFRLSGEPVGPGLLSRADELDVAAVRMPVLAATDLVLSWLRAFSEHHADFAMTLMHVRPLREQVDWERVRAEVGDSPFADAFLVLLERLRVLKAGIR
ncbi:MAG TPA: nucleotidyltransferase [Streptosporangiaceae bacterium]|nr:nucleotidyltransferase [Streptosporangiaceae bacterium]